MRRIVLLLILTGFTLGGFGQDLEKLVLMEAGSGTQYKLSSLNTAQASVLIFWGNRCAYNTYYVDRINNLVTDFKPAGIHFILVNSHNSKIFAEESEQYMKSHLQKHQLGLPYLVDKEQKLMKTFGATRSPEVFLIKTSSGTIEIIYSGAIDDSPPSEGDVNHPHLRNAILSLLDNNKPAATRTRPAGCLIR